MESGEAFLVSLLVAVVFCCAVPLKMNLKDDSLFPLIFVDTSFFLLVADGGERFFFSTSLLFFTCSGLPPFCYVLKTLQFLLPLFYLWSVCFFFLFLSVLALSIK